MQCVKPEREHAVIHVHTHLEALALLRGKPVGCFARCHTAACLGLTLHPETGQSPGLLHAQDMQSSDLSAAAWLHGVCVLLFGEIVLEEVCAATNCAYLCEKLHRSGLPSCLTR